MIKTRTTVKIISFLSALLIVAFAFAIKEKVKSDKYLLMIQKRKWSSKNKERSTY